MNLSLSMVFLLGALFSFNAHASNVPAKDAAADKKAAAEKEAEAKKKTPPKGKPSPGRAVTLKLATMVPRTSAFGEKLVEFQDDVAKATENRVKVEFEFGGTAGDELTVFRKIVNGQYQGGLFTANGLSSQVLPDFRALEVPFTFESREQSSKVLQALRPYLNKKLSEGKGRGAYHSLGFFEVGEIYMVSRMSIPAVADLRGKRVWLLGDDQLARAFMSSMRLIPAPYDIPSVYQHLGGASPTIDAAYAPAAAITALQWDGLVGHIIEPPFAYHFQGMVVTQRAWNRVSEQDQKAIEKIVSEYEAKIAATNFTVATSSFNDMIGKGITGSSGSDLKVTKWPESDLKELKKIRDQILKEITDKVISKEVIDLVNKNL